MRILAQRLDHHDCGGGAIALSQVCNAQGWPDKPIRLIVNFGTGGAPDVVARLYAPRLSEALGQPVVVENRAGAGGNIGIEAVVKSPADGYTLLSSASSSFVIGPHIYKLAFDPVKDMVPVAPVALTPMYLVVRPALPVRNVADLIAYIRVNPGKLNFGSAGGGHAPACGGGDDAAHRERPRGACALQGLGRRARRAARRPGGFRVRSGRRDPAGEGGQGAPARSGQQLSLAELSRTRRR